MYSLSEMYLFIKTENSPCIPFVIYLLIKTNKLLGIHFGYLIIYLLIKTEKLDMYSFC